MLRILPLRRTALVLIAVSTAALVARAEPAERFTGPWNVAALAEAPPATWGAVQGRLQEVYYQGEPRHGRPTRVFAYCARPEGPGPFPAMLLVHGGGGTAFAQWAELWAQRGYVALAMDLAGCGPDQKPLPDGGPDQTDATKFANFSDAEVKDMWTYHAVAAILRGHALLASLPEVDPQRVGITGISWGGYLTCIVAGIDARLKVAVPVYGCGFLHEDSDVGWLGYFSRMTPEQRERWVGNFDPSRYLPGVTCPIFFLNGTNDTAYPLPSHRKCWELVQAPKTLRIAVRMPHGHPEGWSPQEIGLFVDSVLKGGPPLAQLGPLEREGRQARATYTAQVPVVQGQLHYTTDQQPVWNQRKWESVEAVLSDGQVTATLPDARPLVFYLSVTDQRGAMVSTEYRVLP